MKALLRLLGEWRPVMHGHAPPGSASREDSVLASVRALAEEIDPRQCGSEGERAAAEWLAQQLGDAAYKVEIDPFRAYATFMAVYAPLTMVGVASLIVAWWWPWAGAIGGAVAAVLLVAENLPLQVLSRFLKFRQSRNVIARRPPTEESAQDIVVMAHVDAPIVSDIRNLVLVRLLFMGMIVSCLVISGVSAAPAFGGPRWVILIGAPFGLHLTVCAGIMIHQALRSPVVPGAGDNASGVAAMLQAARELPPLQRSAVWFVGTGGEEAGLLGAVRLLERHPFDRKRTWFINVDMVSAGTLRTSEAEGMLVKRRCSPHLCRIASDEGAAERLTVPSEVLRAMSTDACAPLSRGYRATTISSTEGHWHQLSDTVENVDPKVVAQAAVLVRRMIQRLDADAAAEVQPT